MYSATRSPASSSPRMYHVKLIAPYSAYPAPAAAACTAWTWLRTHQCPSRSSRSTRTSAPRSRPPPPRRDAQAPPLLGFDAGDPAGFPVVSRMAVSLTRKAGVPVGGAMVGGMVPVTAVRPDGGFDRAGRLGKGYIGRSDYWWCVSGGGDGGCCCRRTKWLLLCRLLFLWPIRFKQFECQMCRLAATGGPAGGAGAEESEVARRVRMFWRSLGPNSEAPVYGADTLGTLFAEEDEDSWNVGRLVRPCFSLILFSVL